MFILRYTQISVALVTLHTHTMRGEKHESKTRAFCRMHVSESLHLSFNSLVLLCVSKRDILISCTNTSDLLWSSSFGSYQLISECTRLTSRGWKLSRAIYRHRLAHLLTAGHLSKVRRHKCTGGIYFPSKLTAKRAPAKDWHLLFFFFCWFQLSCEEWEEKNLPAAELLLCARVHFYLSASAPRPSQQFQTKQLHMRPHGHTWKSKTLENWLC